tara:strand:+ start:1614 stop:1877 length:264 start_codon:yes stop_codon:yes gene_type:complete
MAEEQKIEDIEYEEETPEVEVDLKDEKEKEEVEDASQANETPANIPDKLDKISDEKIRGRIIIFDATKSEFAKNLKIEKPGDYVEKK